jgi:hypothetical protein
MSFLLRAAGDCWRYDTSFLWNLPLSLACGSMVLSFFCRSFFALQGRKKTYRGEEIHGLHKP